MAFKSGLFTRQQAHGRGVQTGVVRTSRAERNVEYAKSLDASYANREMNPSAKNPGMPPVGEEAARVYMVQKHPSSFADKVNEGWSDEMSKWVVNTSRLHLLDDLRAWYACPTVPKDTAKPTDLNFYATIYGKQLRDDVESNTPEVVVTFGSLALTQIAPALASYGQALYGKFFPIQIGEHRCFVYPMPDPATFYFAHTTHLSDPKSRHAPDSVVWFTKMLERVDSPPEFPENFRNHISRKGAEKLVDVVMDMPSLRAHFKRMRKSALICTDIETDNLRPMRAKIGILCVAFTYKRKGKTYTFSFPYKHPDNPWSDAEREEIRTLVQDALTHNPRQGKLAHNAFFEQSWFRTYMGLDKNAMFFPWEDSFLQACVLDSRGGTRALDFRCLLYFGLPLKDQSSLNVKKLANEDLTKVLLYCGLDTYWTMKVYEVQDELLEAEDLYEPYTAKLESVPLFVEMHQRGVAIDQPYIQGLRDAWIKEQKLAKQRMRKSPEAVRFRKHTGVELNPLSNDQLVSFVQMLGYTETTSCTLSVQRRVAAKHPMMEHIITYRKLNKLLSTYVLPYCEDSPDTVLYPDGRIHPVYNPAGAETGRTSAEDPSVQNVPARDLDARKVRAAFVADVGEWGPFQDAFDIVFKKSLNDLVLVSSDYGQIEARVLAMASRDKVFTNALIHDLDVHLEWAEKIADEFPEILEITHGGKMKSMRSAIKNQVVFPLFYGSSMKSVAKSLGIEPQDFAALFKEFWNTFRGVAAWQKVVTKQYADNGYVTCLHGDRRYGPLSYNAVINTPIQGSASAIVVRAGVRLAQHAYETGRPWLIQQLNIHDDGLWSVPRWDLDQTVDDITRIQVEKHFEFQTGVPVTVNPSVGDNWMEMKEIGTIVSTY